MFIICHWYVCPFNTSTCVDDIYALLESKKATRLVFEPFETLFGFQHWYTRCFAPLVGIIVFLVLCWIPDEVILPLLS